MNNLGSIKQFVTAWKDVADVATNAWLDLLTANPILKSSTPCLQTSNGNGNGSTIEKNAVPEQKKWKHTRSTSSREDLKVGDRFEFSKTLTDIDVKRFAVASGDTNPLHLSDEYAEQTRFNGRIVHGTLVNGLTSAALARVPGEVIYVSNSTKFLRPVPIGETLTAICEIVEELDQDQFRFRTSIETEAGKQVIEGEATVLIDEVPEGEQRRRDHYLALHY